MILSDFECKWCKCTHEAIVKNDEGHHNCPYCGRRAKKIITMGRVYLGNQDAEWIKSVVDVVDKESPKPHVQEFVRNPNRKNYMAWMKGEGIRPVDHTDHGGPPVYRKPPEPDMTTILPEMARRHMAREGLEINSRE